MNRHIISVCFLIALSMPISMSLCAADQYPDGVEVTEVSINGIRLTSKGDEIVMKLGKPERIVDHGIDEIVGGIARTFYYSGLEIYLIDGEIFGLECTGTTCITDRGIRIGDDRQKVEQAYGASSEYEKKGDRLGYPFRTGGVYVDSSLVFYFRNNKVTRIIFHVDYT